MIKLQLQFLNSAPGNHRCSVSANAKRDHRYHHARVILHILNCDAGCDPHAHIRRLAEEYRAVLVDELLVDELAVP